MSLMTQVGMEFIARDRSRAGINSFRGNLNRTSRTVKSLGRSLLAIAGVGGGLYILGNMFRSGVTEAAAFEKQMANVSTMLSDQSMSLMPRYNQQIREMSRQFGEGTETLSKGLYDILSASVAPAKALDVLAVSARAAKAGITDTGTAADAITTILNSYSLEAERAADVSDKMFAIVVRGKTTFGDLAPNIGKVTALAATAGESFDDLGAAIATMTRAGVQTEIAITSLRAIILSFLKPQSDSIEMARKYGVELNSTTLRTIGLTGVMQKLKNATAEELAVIVPTSRAITGFAAAIQKADALAGDYDFVLNSLGATEKAYQKIAETSAHSLEQAQQQWIDIKRTVGDAILPALTTVLESMSQALDENRGAIRRWADDVVEGGNMIKKVLPIYWLYTGLKIKDLKAQLAEAQTMSAQAEPVWPDVSEMRVLGAETAETAGRAINAPTRSTRAQEVEVVKRTNAQIVADTREQLTSVRAMHDKTRMEKIWMLENYKVAHFGATKEIEAAEKLLNDEILSLQRSRVDAMKVYEAELRANAQNTALYVSEKNAEAARSIESSMSSAFQSMAQDSNNWKDHLQNLFASIGAAFAKMVSDMIAQWIMLQMIRGIGGALGGGGDSTTGAGSAAGGTPTRHSGWVPEGVPSFHGGRGLRSNEMVAVIEKDELLAPNDQVIKSDRDLPGSDGRRATINIFVSAIDDQGTYRFLNRYKGELANLIASEMDNNHPIRRRKR